jgi:predicted GNAT superfamily acetyltransferase
LSHLQSPISFNRDLILNQATLNQKGLLSPPETLQSPIESAHFIQIPPDIEAIKVADMSLAIAWRKQTRYLFESVFAAGYAVTDFVRLAAQNESYYVIQRRS